MDNLSAVWIVLGMVTTVLIVGATWGDVRRQVKTLAEQWDRDRTETREWLKSLQAEQTDHGGKIKVLLDRSER